MVQLIKQCHNMLEAGRVYCQSSKSFVNGLRELGRHCSTDNLIGVSAGPGYHSVCVCVCVCVCVDCNKSLNVQDSLV